MINKLENKEKTYMNISKQEIVSKISNATGLTKCEIEAVIDSFVILVNQSLEQGYVIGIRGLGSFDVVNKSSKIVQNKKGQNIRVPERKVPRFNPSVELKRTLNKG